MRSSALRMTPAGAGRMEPRCSRSTSRNRASAICSWDVGASAGAPYLLLRQSREKRGDRLFSRALVERVARHFREYAVDHDANVAVGEYIAAKERELARKTGGVTRRSLD